MNFTKVTSNGSCCWEMFSMNNDTNEIWPGDSKKLNISNILTIKSKQCNGKGAFVGKCLHRKMFAWKFIHMQNNGPIELDQKIAFFGSEIWKPEN